MKLNLICIKFHQKQKELIILDFRGF